MRPRFAIVICSRRGLDFAPRCLESLQWQIDHRVQQVVYVDDASGYDVSQLRRLHSLLEPLDGELVVNTSRLWQAGSFAQGLARVRDPGAVVCLVDGDDWLLPHALRAVARAYEDPEVAMTWGNTLVDFRPFQDPQVSYFGVDKATVNTEYSPEVWRDRTFREDGFRCFHLRTFRRWLWDYVRPEDLRMPTGAPFRGSGDSALVFPLLELLGQPCHVRFIEDPIYVYRLHAQQVHQLDKAGQHEGLETLRYRMERYPPLERGLLYQHLKEHR